MMTAVRAIELEGISNFRDMGGYVTEDGRKVKWGRLFRSADLSRATAADIEKIRALHLAWICDLRTLNEREKNQSPMFADEINEHMSFLESADPNKIAASEALNEHLLEDLNRQMVHRVDVMQEFVNRWLELKGKPFLFHCTAGKDRTGFIGAFILRALGVSLEQIKQDYSLTNIYWKPDSLLQDEGQHKQLSQLPPAIIKAMIEARESYINAAFDEIEQRYGGFAAYWSEALGFTDDQLQSLRNDYLE